MLHNTPPFYTARHELSPQSAYTANHYDFGHDISAVMIDSDNELEVCVFWRGGCKSYFGENAIELAERKIRSLLPSEDTPEPETVIAVIAPKLPPNKPATTLF